MNFICTNVCVCTCISTGVGVCAYSYGPDHPDMRIYEAEIALISKISHASGRTSTNKQRLMDIDVQGSCRKKTEIAKKL